MGHNSSSPLTPKPIPTNTPKEVFTMANLFEQKKIQEIISVEKLHTQAKLHSFGFVSFTVKANKPFEDVKNINGYVQVYLDQGDKKHQIFEGELINGVRWNYGVQFDNKGNTFYEGTFKNNKYHGWGITQNYQGEWINGMKHGWGIYTDSITKSRYEGLWKENHFHGMGAYNLQSNEITSFLKEQTVKNSNISSRYVGEWSQGNMHGCGKLSKSSENQVQTYEGQFCNGIYEGQGKLKQNNEQAIVGKFQNGKFVK